MKVALDVRGFGPSTQADISAFLSGLGLSVSDHPQYGQIHISGADDDVARAMEGIGAIIDGAKQRDTLRF